MTKYVLGFLFSTDLSKVVLIRKQQPEWMRGLLNGVGGKVESREFPTDTMVREFEEEAGVKIIDWKYYSIMLGTDTDNTPFTVYCYYTVTDPINVKTMEEEEVGIFEVSEVIAGKLPIMKNLPWLITAALDFITNPRPPSFITANYE